MPLDIRTQHLGGYFLRFFGGIGEAYTAGFRSPGGEYHRFDDDRTAGLDCPLFRFFRGLRGASRRGLETVFTEYLFTLIFV